MYCVCIGLVFLCGLGSSICSRTRVNQGCSGLDFFGFRVGSGLSVRVTGRVGFFVKHHFGFRVLQFGFRVIIRVINQYSDLIEFRYIFWESDFLLNFRCEQSKNTWFFAFQSNLTKKSSSRVEFPWHIFLNYKVKLQIFFKIGYPRVWSRVSGRVGFYPRSKILVGSGNDSFGSGSRVFGYPLMPYSAAPSLVYVA